MLNTQTRFNLQVSLCRLLMCLQTAERFPLVWQSGTFLNGSLVPSGDDSLCIFVENTV